MDLSQEVDAGPQDEPRDDFWISDLADPEGRTDLANARRFVARYGKQARYCFAWKKWLVWDGTRWQVDTLGAVRRMAQDVADDVWTQYRLAGQHLDAQRWASFTSSEHGMRRMLAGAEVRLAVTPDELDDYPWLLNCLNGVLDLRTGELLAHDPAWMLTKLCPVEFHAEATSELWERTVAEMMSHDPEMIALLQQLAGYFLTGDVQEQVMPILIGDGANGKSTFVDAIAGVLSDYATPLDPTVIASKWSDEVHPDGEIGARGKTAGDRLRDVGGMPAQRSGCESADREGRHHDTADAGRPLEFSPDSQDGAGHEPSADDQGNRLRDPATTAADLVQAPVLPGGVRQGPTRAAEERKTGNPRVDGAGMPGVATHRPADSCVGPGDCGAVSERAGSDRRTDRHAVRCGTGESNVAARPGSGGLSAMSVPRRVFPQLPHPLETIGTTRFREGEIGRDLFSRTSARHGRTDGQ